MLINERISYVKYLHNGVFRLPDLPHLLLARRNSGYSCKYRKLKIIGRSVFVLPPLRKMKYLAVTRVSYIYVDVKWIAYFNVTECTYRKQSFCCVTLELFIVKRIIHKCAHWKIFAKILSLKSGIFETIYRV